jgi:PAS domain S-box-containing protein
VGPKKKLPSIHILLVEDNEHDRAAFRIALKKRQVACEITECMRAEAALERLRGDSSSFDIAVVDHGLPGTSGLDLCRELISKEISLPLVILTGRGSEQLAVEALKAGVEDYIVKDPTHAYLDLLPVVLMEVMRRYGERQARKRAEEQLQVAHNELEQRVEERTAELARTTEQLTLELNKRKRTEDALRQSEQKYSTLIESSLTGIYIDQKGKIVFANRRFAEIYGYSKEELAGIESWKLVHPEDRPLTDMIRAKRVKGEEVPEEYEARGLTKDGATIWILRRNKRIDYKGKPAILGNIVDVTDRKRAEAALRDSEERYRTVLEACPDPVIVYDMQGRGIYINPAFTRVFGWTSEEIIGNKLDYVPPASWPETQKMIDNLLAGEKSPRVESRRYTKEGKILDVSISADSYLNGYGIPVGSVHILRDITGRKQAEEALRKARDELEQRVEERTAELMILNQQLKREIDERKRTEKELKSSEEKYRLLFNYDPNPLFVVDADSAKILDVNQSASSTYQYDRKELLEMCFPDLLEPEDGDQLWKDIARHVEDEYIFRAKLRARRKDGDLFFINFHSSVGKFEELDERAFGPSYVIRTVDMARRLQQEAQLLQSSKLATLGEMATGIAHELNQPLNVIRVGADFLARMTGRGDEISDDQLLKVSRNMSDQVERASNIINHLRDFGRRTDFNLYPLDINEPIRDVFTILGEQFRLRDIELGLELNENLPKILGDKNRVEQVFLNLVTNARDAMAAKGARAIKKLTITTYERDGKVVALFADTGVGISKEILEKIFEPFFTTKEVGEGTGLGLSISYGLVRDLGGDIAVQSTSKKGTVFEVSFPVHEKETHLSEKRSDQP